MVTEAQPYGNEKGLDSLCVWNPQNLLLGFHLHPFLLLGCDSPWRQALRVITVICEFPHRHTLC